MKKFKKYAAGFLSFALALGMVTGCGAGSSDQTDTEEAEVSEESSDLEAKAVSLLKNHGNEEGKEETVYIIADADGNVEKEVVSAWLKNPDEEDTIKDKSDLKDIENVKGNETFTEGGGDEITWNAEGSDIYYQGTSEKELPIDTNITYELDGKKVGAEELAGADGHLKISFTYDNNTKTTKTVNGEKVTMYQPFLVISGLLLDSDKATNIEVTNGKIMASDSKDIVLGMAMPGLSESLGLDDLTVGDEKIDIDIPEDFSVEADVTDFELLTTVTVYDNSALSELNLDDVDSVADLKDSLNDLDDAAVQLVDGTSDLYDGTKELKSGAGTLTEGVSQLSSGASSLKSGTSKITSGADSVVSGVGQVQSGASQLASGADTLSSGANSLAAGAKSIQSGASELSSGLKTLKSYNKSLNSGAKQIADGLGQLDTALTQADLSVLVSGADALSGNLSNKLLPAAQSACTYEKTASDALTSYISSIDMSTLTPEQQKALATAQKALEAAEQYSDGVSSGLSQAAAGAASISSAVSSAAGQLGTAASAVSQLASGAQSLQSGLTTYTAGVTSAAQGAATLSQGVGSLAAGTAQVVSGSSQISSGAATLKSGSAALKTGAGTLSAGGKELAGGTTTLFDGIDQLTSGGAALTSGVDQLVDGSKDLKDGMAKFYNEGIQKLTKLSDSSLLDLVDRLRVLQDYSEEYSSFSGAADGTASSVKFIMRTDSIESKED